MFLSRRTLLTGALALPATAWAGRRGLWDEPGDLGRVVIFRQEGGSGPGVRPAAVRHFVEAGPPATVGLVAAYGLRIMGASERKPDGFKKAIAVLLMPAKMIVLEGQLLVPTLDEALRALLAVEAVPPEEIADDTWPRLQSGAPVTSDELLARARPVAIQALQAHDEGVLRRLGMAQLGAWHLTPPPGYATPAG